MEVLVALVIGSAGIASILYEARETDVEVEIADDGDFESEGDVVQ